MHHGPALLSQGIPVSRPSMADPGRHASAQPGSLGRIALSGPEYARKLFVAVGEVPSELWEGSRPGVFYWRGLASVWFVPDPFGHIASCSVDC